MRVGVGLRLPPACASLHQLPVCSRRPCSLSEPAFPGTRLLGIHFCRRNEAASAYAADPKHLDLVVVEDMAADARSACACCCCWCCHYCVLLLLLPAPLPPLFLRAAAPAAAAAATAAAAAAGCSHNSQYGSARLMPTPPHCQRFKHLRNVAGPPHISFFAAAPLMSTERGLCYGAL